MPPFMKIQTPWTEQEGKASVSVAKIDVSKLKLASFSFCVKKCWN